MDWNTFELVSFCVLSLGPIVILTLAGRMVRAKRSSTWLNWYLILGIGCSTALLLFGGRVLGIVFPPPYEPSLAGGRGLDLRGILLVFGTLVGGVTGIVTTGISFSRSYRMLP